MEIIVFVAVVGIFLVLQKKDKEKNDDTMSKLINNPKVKNAVVVDNKKKYK